MIKDSDGSTEGCHPTKKAAEEQMAALYVNEPSADLAEAANNRAKAARDQPQPAQKQARRVIPSGAARLQPFPGQFRVKPVERNGKELRQLDGIASATDRAYEMWDLFGTYNEVIDGEAFDATLAANPDVAFLVNHKGVTMARTSSNTLELSVDALGLHARAFVNPERQDVRDLLVAIDDKDITEMSFAFTIEDGEWNEDYTEFRIKQVSLDRGDVSAVNYGANPYTSIAARAHEVLADLDHLPVGAARAAMQRLARRADLTPSPPVAPQSDPQPDAVTQPNPPTVEDGASVNLIRARMVLMDTTR